MNFGNAGDWGTAAFGVLGGGLAGWFTSRKQIRADHQGVAQRRAEVLAGVMQALAKRKLDIDELANPRRFAREVSDACLAAAPLFAEADTQLRVEILECQAEIREAAAVVPRSRSGDTDEQVETRRQALSSFDLRRRELLHGLAYDLRAYAGKRPG